MGACYGATGMRDAFGKPLEDKFWVQCTSNVLHKGLGRPEKVGDNSVIFQWPTGAYDYKMTDIYYGGIRRTMADATGKQFSDGQLVKTAEDRMGVARKLSDDEVGILFERSNGAQSDMDQQSVDSLGVVISGVPVTHRQIRDARARPPDLLDCTVHVHVAKTLQSSA